MADLVEETPSRVLAIYAHPDDPDVACGGALARWARAGAEVHVLLATDGEKGTLDPDVDPENLVVTRSAEIADASRILGVSHHHLLHHRDGELVDDLALRRQLVACIREVKPDVVCCPDPTAVFFGQDYFNHRDHRTIGWAALDALSPAAGLPHYFPDSGPAHQVGVAYLSGTLSPDVWIDITDTIDLKTDAVGCHRSQLVGDREWARTAVRQRAEEAGRAAGCRFAEGFRRLRLGG